MEITEVRVKLVQGGRQEKLKAFCSITIDDAFVVRDLKVIEGSKGLFVAMPSRKLTVRCHSCGSKNQVRSQYCADCGRRIPPERHSRAREGRSKLHADIAHPINSDCREDIQARVLECFEREYQAAQQPGYQPQEYDEQNYDEIACEEEHGDDERYAEPQGNARSQRARGHSEPTDAHSGLTGTLRERAPQRQPWRGTSRIVGLDSEQNLDDLSLDPVDIAEFRERRPASARRRRTARDFGEKRGELRPGREAIPKSTATQRPAPVDSKDRDPKEQKDLPPEDNFGLGIF